MFFFKKLIKKQNNGVNVSGDDSRILRSSGVKLNNEFSDEISEEKLKADYERNHLQFIFWAGDVINRFSVNVKKRFPKIN